MDIKEIRLNAGMSIKEFSEYLNIPYRTIQNWESGTRKCTDYIVELIKFRIENREDK